MLTSLGARVAAALDRIDPWGTGYALARTLLALSTLSTLAASRASSLFLPVVGRPDFPYCDDLAGFGLFCLVPDGLHAGGVELGALDVGRAIAIGILIVAGLGFWPRLLGLLQWWVTFSFQANATMVDGGDQIAAILLLLLLPCCLTDPRWNHWRRMPAGPPRNPHLVLWAAMSHVTVRAQVAIIYFHACVGKFKVPEWLDGTVLYYWVFDPQFGATGLVRDLLAPIVMSPAVAWLTWSVMGLELALAIGVFLSTTTRRALLWPAILLHGGIAMIHGLLSFSLAMWAGLTIYAGVNAELTATFRSLGSLCHWHLRPLGTMGFNLARRLSLVRQLVGNDADSTRNVPVE
jgi:antimicrobial peptide system SdpB family protein